MLRFILCILAAHGFQHRPAHRPRATQRSAAADAATALPEILDLLAPYGSPALNVPTDVAAKVDDAVRRLERDAPPAPLSALDGRWRVEYATAPA